MTAATTSPIRVSAPVRAALDEGRPVVALESTIFTHGLPRPRNLEVALEGEEIARSHGAVPATIGVFRGEPVVGLSKAEIEELSGSEGLLKASVRELAYARVRERVQEALSREVLREPCVGLSQAEDVRLKERGLVGVFHVYASFPLAASAP